jgi:hypothetical protein
MSATKENQYPMKLTRRCLGVNACRAYTVGPLLSFAFYITEQRPEFFSISCPSFHLLVSSLAVQLEVFLSDSFQQL